MLTATLFPPPLAETGLVGFAGKMLAQLQEVTRAAPCFLIITAFRGVKP
jgi:hypothetical protein